MSPREQFQKTFDPAKDSWLHHHRYDHQPVLPAAAQLDMALTAAALLNQDASLRVENAVFMKPVVFEDAGPWTINLDLTTENGGLSFELSSAHGPHTQGTLAAGVEPVRLFQQTQDGETLDPARYYDRCRELGLTYGEPFQTIKTLTLFPRAARARLRTGQADHFLTRTLLLDGALQVLAALTPAHRRSTKFGTLPFSVGVMHLDKALTDPIEVVAQLTREQGDMTWGDILLLDEQGNQVGYFKDVCLRATGSEKAKKPSRETAASWLHTIQWQTARPEPFEPDTRRDWLIIAEDHPFTQTFSSFLTAEGVSHQLHTLGEEPLDMAGLHRDLGDGLLKLGGVLFLCGAQQPDFASPEQIQAWVSARTYALVDTTRALVKAGQQVPLWVVTRRGMAVMPGEKAEPAAGAFWGLARALVWEFPAMKARRIDLATDGDAVTLWNALHQQAEELAIREKRMLVPRLEPIAAEATPAATLHGGRYLLSGGLGGIGLVLAEYLAEKGATHLFLLSRRGLEGNLDESTLARIAALRTQTRLCVYAADVAVAQDMADVAKLVAKEVDRLDAVFHVAGVVRDSLIMAKTRDQVDATLTPKILGTHHLLDHMEALKPSVRVLFSSATSVFGNLGQTDYAAANAYLDQLAHAYSVQGRATVSLNWSLWRQVGMGVQLVDIIAKRGFQAIDNTAAMAALEQALAAGGAQYVVARFVGGGPKAAVLAQRDLDVVRPVTEAKTTQPATGAGSVSARKARVRKAVLAALETDLSLRPEDVDHDAPFLSFGVDSIVAVSLVKSLESVFHTQLRPTLFFEYGTLTELVEGLIENVAVDVAAAAETATPEPQDLEPGEIPEAQVASILTPGPAVIPESQTGAAAESPGDQVEANAVAVIGISGRFPGAEDIDTFWENQRRGHNAIGTAPKRWPGSAGSDGTARMGGFLAEVEAFDFDFFRISPKEGKSLDPQQRLALELAWEALEDGGYAGGTVSRETTGIFLGASYQHFRDAAGLAWVDNHTALGNHNAILANRISFFLDSRGPCLTVDTLCSSSLVALQLAVENLRRGDCKLAIAGGVHVGLSEWYYRSLDQLRAISPTGACHSFDEKADGYIPGEGGGMVLLKPLARALADNDRIHAVIRGVATNHGGRAGGMTVPRAQAQAEVIQAAMADAQVQPDQLHYLETHGTGTALGDPIEIEALRRVFHGLPHQSLAIGTVKANIGHLEPAAGIAGMIKAICILQRGELPPAAHLRQPNHRILFENTPFYLNDRARKLNHRERLAGVSSFGMGGVNAHVVLASAPRRPHTPRPTGPSARLLKLSARHDDALGQLIEAYFQQAMVGADFCFTANVGRADWEKRAAVLIQPGQQPAQAPMWRSGTAELPSEHLSRLTPECSFLLQTWCAGALFEEHIMETLPQADTKAPDPRILREETWRGLLEVVGVLFCLGVSIHWEKLEADTAAREGSSPQRVALPKYPFQRQRLPLPPFSGSVGNGAFERIAPGLDGVRFYATLNPLHHPWLVDHAFQRDTLVPLAAWLIQLQHAARYLDLAGSLELGSFNLQAPCRVTDQVTTELTARKDEQGRPTFTLKREQTLLAKCLLVGVQAPVALPPIEQTPREPGSELYDWYNGKGMNYGPSLRVIRRFWADHRNFKTNLESDQALALVDGALQSVGTVTRLLDNGSPLPMPLSAASIWLRDTLPQRATVLGRVDTGGLAQGRLLVDLDLLDEQGDLCLAFRGLRYQGGIAPKDRVSAKIQTVSTAPPTRRPAGLAMDLVKALLVEHLEIPPQAFKPDRAFLELGMDSISAVNMVESLRRDYAVDLPSTLFFDHGNPHRLAEFLSTLPELQQAMAGDGEPKQALLELERAAASEVVPAAQPVSQVEQEGDPHGVAVIGMAGCFPGAAELDTFWKNILAGKSFVGEIPEDRWNWRAYFDRAPGADGKTYSRWGGFLDAPYGFDAAFFRYFPREAEAMDPQQRLLLETVWQTLQNAAVSPREVEQQTTGVFVGASYHHYKDLDTGPNLDAYTGLGNQNAFLANRVSYWYNLTGPSFTLDTLCSSSLVALHQAVRSLRSGECSLALVAGVHAGLTPYYYQNLCRLRALSPQGRCKTLDTGADGYVPGEGVGVVLLKPLQKAQADGDPIRGIIGGSAVNHGGRGSGLTVPGAKAQQAVITAALADARLDAGAVAYVETHGTGTHLGDPIEVAGLEGAFATAEEGSVALGALKAQIGHLEPAAGIAALIKTLLALEAATIPPVTHVNQPNPDCRFQITRLPKEATPWPERQGGRFAGVSSFGMGGVNAHVILQQAPAPVQETQPGPHCFLFAAPDLPAMIRVVDRYLRAAARYADASALAAALASGLVGTHPVRLAVVAEDLADLWQTLAQARDQLVDNQTVDLPAVHFAPESDPPPKLALMFTGQGSQYAAMGTGLYGVAPVYTTNLDRCIVFLEEQGIPARALLGLDPAVQIAADAIHRTGFAQPTLFALEYALAKQWLAWGLPVDAVCGHSVGELAAAAIAGVYSLEDGLRLICIRAGLMQSLPGGEGGMAVIFADAETVRGLIADLSGLEIAALNGPKNTVVAGFPSALALVRERAEEAGLRLTRLATSHAFHSPQMDPILEPFVQKIAAIEAGEPRLLLLSNLSGGYHQGAPNAAYWRDHLRRPVAYADCVTTLQNDGVTLFLEVGPKPVLTGITRRLVLENISCLGGLVPMRKGLTALAETVAQLYAAGLDLAWSQMVPRVSRRASLQPYPFKRTHYRFTAEQTAPAVATRTAASTTRFYLPDWQELASRPEEITTGAVLIISNYGEATEELISRLEADKRRVLHLQAGPGQAPETLKTHLVNLLRAEGGLITACLLKWHEPHTLEAALFLGRTLMELERTSPHRAIPCLLLGRGRAALQAVARALAGECRRLRWRYLEADDAGAVKAELACEDGPAVVRRRGTSCSTSSWRPHQPTGANQPRRGGCYLITGGMGGIGRAMATHLARHYNARLALVGRSPLPKEHDHPKRQFLQELEALAGRVRYYPVDVADGQAVTQLFGNLETDFGGVDGIIHAAGLAHKPGSLAGREPADIQATRAPKVQAARLLAQSMPRDCTLFLCGSVSAHHTHLARGLGDYALANGELEDFSRTQAQNGNGRVRTIIWPEWRAVGMAQNTTGAHETPGPSALTQEQGVQVFIDCWSLEVPVALPGLGPFDVAAFTAGDRAAALLAMPKDGQPLQASCTPGTAVDNEVMGKIMAAFAAVLKTDQLDPSLDFGSMGLDSLLIADLSTALEAQFGHPVEPGWLLEHPSLNRLAAFLDGHLSQSGCRTDNRHQPESREDELSQLLTRMSLGELSLEETAILLEQTK